MSYKYFIEELIGIQDFKLLDIKNNENELHIYMVLDPKEHICPCCKSKTRKIHDYRWQIIKDLSSFGKHVYIHLKKRRYRCSCGKRIPEKVSFLPKYYRMTRRLINSVFVSLSNEYSFTSIAKQHNISVSTAIRIFDVFYYNKPKQLPNVLSIDEFKGNAGGEKYLCILADPQSHTVIDILPTRNENYLLKYFLDYSKSDRNAVSTFISDMWKPYQATAKTLFRPSLKVIDKYHWIRQIIWAFEKVRKDTQKKLSRDLQVYFKRSRSILLKRFDYLSEYDKQRVMIMLYYSSDISTAHFYKEEFQKIICAKDINIAKHMMNEWIDSAIICGVKPIENCAKTMIRWKNEILNSFNTHFTNGYIEGCNNKIKVLKRNAYGYRNFNRFRNRILHMFNY